jgi:hypothetical protein
LFSIEDPPWGVRERAKKLRNPWDSLGLLMPLFLYGSRFFIRNEVLEDRLANALKGRHARWLRETDPKLCKNGNGAGMAFRGGKVKKELYNLYFLDVEELGKPEEPRTFAEENEVHPVGEATR